MKKLLFVFVIQIISLAGVPPIINYQGHIRVAGAEFSGPGQFKFALVNDTGSTTLWSNDGTSAGGNQPTAAVPLPLSRGVFSVKLGDPTVANMLALPLDIFARDDLRLRVWFSDGVNGFQQLTPDQRLASVAYAFNASTVDGIDSTALALKTDLTAASNALSADLSSARLALQTEFNNLEARESASTARMDAKDADIQSQLAAASTQLQANINEHTAQLTSHSQRLNQHDARLNSADTAIATVQKDVSDIQPKLIEGFPAVTDLKVNGTNVMTVVKDYYDAAGTLLREGPGIVLNVARANSSNRWHWTGYQNGFFFGRVGDSGFPIASAGEYDANSGWNFVGAARINGNTVIAGDLSPSTFKCQNLSIVPDGPVTGIQAGGGGSLAGFMRYRNVLEVWPNLAGTAAGKIDVRNKAGAATITLNGDNGSVVATTVTPSDRNIKQDFQPVDPHEILNKVAALPITRWSYKHDPQTPHLGPVAQDFHAAFQLGFDDKTIAAVDADGIALASIQALHQRLAHAQAQLDAREEKIQSLERRLAALETLLQKTSISAE